MCPPCSEKLNYRSKKREIKRLKHEEKVKNKERNPNEKKTKKKDRDSESQSPESSRANEEDDKDILEKEENVVAEIEEEPANVWEGKDRTAEQVIREDEFGKYLEDLLL